MTCLCHFIFLFDLLILTIGFGILGPADFIFKNFEGCEDPVDVVVVKITQRKFNRSTDVLDIIIDTPIPIDDKIIMEMKGSSKVEGGYKPGSFYMKDGACKTLSTTLGEMFTNILKAAGTEKCPLPVGIHHANDYYFDNTKFTVPAVYGEYKMEIKLTDGDELVSCTIMYYDISPKSYSFK